MLVAVSAASAIFGLTSNAMVGNYSLHFSLCGLARDEIPLLISVYGLTLAVGKLLLGVMCDRFGTVRSVMLSYMLGALLFSPVPGITADIFGDYGFIYTVMSVLNTVGILMVLLTYRQYGKMAE